MSEALPNYVKGRYARTSSLGLSSWLLDNPLPAICEPEFDGQRVFFFKSGDRLVISGGSGSIYTPASTPAVFSKVPELVGAPNRLILDGEYVPKEGLHLFDLLQIDDRDLGPLPLYRRKEMLHELIADSGMETDFIWVDSREEIQKFADEITSRGGDGILVKNPQSFYGQSNSWGRVRRSDSVDCFVIDVHEEDSSGKKSWTIAVYDPVGKIVTLGEVSSISDRVNPGKVRLGSVVEVRFHLSEFKLIALFISKLRRDKPAIECLISQIPEFEKMLLS